MGPELGLLLQAEQGLRFESHEVYSFFRLTRWDFSIVPFFEAT